MFKSAFWGLIDCAYRNMMRVMQANENIAEYRVLPDVRLTENQQRQCLAELAEGATWKEAAASIGLQEMALLRFRDSHSVFEAETSRAIEQHCHAMADSLLNIPDEYANRPLVARLKSDNIKWWLSKRLQKIYGDKLDLSIDQTVSIRAALDAAETRIVRPMRDLTHESDTQVIDLTAITEPASSDNESLSTPGTKDAASLTLDDLLG